MPKYDKTDLDISDGVEIESVRVTGEDGRENRLTTFMEEAVLRHYGKFTITFHRQNYGKFQFNIKVSNRERSVKKVIFRIFLGRSRYDDIKDKIEDNI